MAKKITIPLADHDTNCTAYYLVEYKLSGASGYNSFNAFTDQVEINNVADNSIYDVRITRNCCNGGVSAPLVLVIDTTNVSPQLDMPENFVLTPGDTQIAADCDEVANADYYIWQIAKDDEFTVNAQEVTTAGNNHSFTGLTNGTLYYVKVKARASGYADSNWTPTTTATPTAS